MIKGVNGKYTFPGSLYNAQEKVSVYTISGKLIFKGITKDISIDIKRKIGAKDGLYIVGFENF